MAIGAVFAGLLSLADIGAAHAADTVVVGTGGSASDAPFYIAKDKGYFQVKGSTSSSSFSTPAPR